MAIDDRDECELRGLILPRREKREQLGVCQTANRPGSQECLEVSTRVCLHSDRHDSPHGPLRYPQYNVNGQAGAGMSGFLENSEKWLAGGMR